MKKYVEILEEIKKLKEKITTSKETAWKNFVVENYYKISKNADEQTRQATREKIKALRAEAEKETARNEFLKIKIEILKDNAKNALFAELVGVVCDTWNRYEGKTHGEKTAQKIRAELKEATGGVFVSVSNSYGDACIKISTYGQTTPFFDIEILPVRMDKKYPAISTSNKVVKISPENFRLAWCGEYVEDVDAHVQKLQEAHAIAQEKEKELEQAISDYNSLIRGGIDRINSRDGIRPWIL